MTGMKWIKIDTGIFDDSKIRRVKQIQRAYRLAYHSAKCWLERKQLRGMIFWRDERG